MDRVDDLLAVVIELVPERVDLELEQDPVRSDADHSPDDQHRHEDVLTEPFHLMGFPSNERRVGRPARVVPVLLLFLLEGITMMSAVACI